jgi:HEXXH motif-containing protein
VVIYRGPVRPVVQAERQFQANRRCLVPDDGSGGPVPRWSGTPLIRAVTDGLAWQVLLEAEDGYLHRYTLPMAADLRAEDIQHWRQRAQAAWQVLVRHHRWAAEALPDAVSVIVPLTPHSETDLVSVTTPAAFGAIATSWPPDPVTMAETLVHEGQHVKLSGLLDMVPLVTSDGKQVYAPWRQDPRPAGGLLQGVYAHLGIARFWNAQRRAETDPDDVLRAQVHFARWRTVIDRAAQTLLRTDCLTPAGERFGHGYVDIGPQVRSVTMRVAKRRRRGWVHIPVPAPAERALPLSRTRTPLRSPSLAIAPPPRPLEGATAEDLPLVSAHAAR